MTRERKKHKHAVITTAAELIRGYLETGIDISEQGFDEDIFKKEIVILYKQLLKKAEKVKQVKTQP